MKELTRAYLKGVKSDIAATQPARGSIPSSVLNEAFYLS
jgi:hypothetical protein